MQEYIVLADENGMPIGTAPKLASHHATTPLHLAFSIFLFNQKGELLLQQRSSKKKTWPLIWSNSVCGHQKSDEKLEITALNRLAFEMGIRKATIQLILPTFRYRCEMNGIWENEICPVFVGTTTEEPSSNEDEVASYQWISWKKWLKEIVKYPSKYSYWSIKETEGLLINDTFNLFLQQVLVTAIMPGNIQKAT